MIRDLFTYEAPSSADEASDLLAQGDGDTAIMGGGTWLVWEMTSGRRRPRRVIDLTRAGLSGISTKDGWLHIGAMTSYTALTADPEVPPLLREMAASITGGAQIRNQGTIGGSLCYANPASDAPGALVALGARARLRGVGGTRDVPVGDFLTGAFRTAIGEGELLTAILVPAFDPGTRFGYVKFKLCESSWPIVTAGCVVDPTGALRSLAIGGAAPRPYTVDVTDMSDDDVEDRARAALPEPYADVHASGAFRRHVAGVMAKRAVAAAKESTHG